VFLLFGKCVHLPARIALHEQFGTLAEVLIRINEVVEFAAAPMRARQFLFKHIICEVFGNIHVRHGHWFFAIVEGHHGSIKFLEAIWIDVAAIDWLGAFEAFGWILNIVVFVHVLIDADFAVSCTSTFDALSRLENYTLAD